MNIEFHYHLIYLLAQRAGFSNEESNIIAYSSQYVDDNTIRIKIKIGEKDEYKNYISQTINILKPKPKLMRIYPCFHFIPGDYDSDSAKRKDGKLHLLNTTPKSRNANILMDEALSTKNLYRIGICAHAYADTWAHQGFVGYFDSFNSRGGTLEKLTPNIGHADAQTLPDIPGMIWEDKSLIKENREVRNKERFVEAAEYIFRKFKAYLSPNENKERVEKEWKRLKTEIEKAIGEEFRDKDIWKKKRISNYKQLAADFIEYDEDEWFDKAIKTKVRGLKNRANWGPLNKISVFEDRYFAKSGFEDSHWYKFQEAAKDHQRFAVNLYNDLYHQLEVEEY